MKEISEELLKRLDVLAQKMGTTIDHLWQVLVRQAYIEAYLAIFWIIISAVIITVSCRYILKSVEMDEEDPISAGRVTISITLGVLAVILFIVACCNVFSIGYLFNPEYYALGQFKSL